MPGIDSLVEGSFHDTVAEFLNREPIEDKTDKVRLQSSNHHTFEAKWRAHRS